MRGYDPAEMANAYHRNTRTAASSETEIQGHLFEVTVFNKNLETGGTTTIFGGSGLTLATSAHLGCSLLSIEHRTPSGLTPTWTYELGGGFTITSSMKFTPAAQGGFISIENMNPENSEISFDSKAQAISIADSAAFENYGTGNTGGLLFSLQELKTVTLSDITV